MMPFVPSVIILAALFAASITDFRSREVPDTLSYGLIILGCLHALIISVLAWSFWPAVFSGLGFALMAGVSLALYYTGQWGGGDAKLLMGIGTWLGASYTGLSELPSLAVFLINAVLAGGLYGLLWAFYLMLKHRKGFLEELKRQYAGHRPASLIILTLGFMFMGFVLLFIREPAYRLLSLGFAFVMLLGYFLWMAVHAVEQVCFYKRIPVAELTEGDWIVEPVVSEGRVLVKVSDFGVTKPQIEALKNSGIKDVLVKEGIPFVPSLLAAFILTVLYYDWFLFLI
jgi:Flp pilus assembly protein protease CpaA